MSDHGRGLADSGGGTSYTERRMFVTDAVRRDVTRAMGGWWKSPWVSFQKTWVSSQEVFDYRDLVRPSAPVGRGCLGR